LGLERRFGMSVRAPFLDKTIGVRVTEADYARLQALADTAGQPVGEWCRKVLLDVAKSPAGKPIEQAVLAEVIALRTVVVNVIYAFTAEGKITAERMQALIEHADSTKSKKAAELLARISRPGKPDADNKTRSAGEAH
jgi:hypothetical protein